MTETSMLVEKLRQIATVIDDPAITEAADRLESLSGVVPWGEDDERLFGLWELSKHGTQQKEEVKAMQGELSARKGFGVLGVVRGVARRHGLQFEELDTSKGWFRETVHFIVKGTQNDIDAMRREVALLES